MIKKILALFKRSSKVVTADITEQGAVIGEFYRFTPKSSKDPFEYDASCVKLLAVRTNGEGERWVQYSDVIPHTDKLSSFKWTLREKDFLKMYTKILT